MADAGYVLIHYKVPRRLHAAAKTMASARGVTLRQFILDSLTAEVARGYAAAREPGGAAAR